MEESNTTKLLKTISTSEEVEGAYELIWEGLRQINNPKLFHLNNSIPLHLLSFGYERLLKILILMYRSNDEKLFPTHDKSKDAFEKGHNLTVLLKELIIKMELETLIIDYPYTQQELHQLKENQILLEFLSILEEYAKFQRFHYLNTLVTAIPTVSNEKNPYLQFLRFHWRFLSEGNYDPSHKNKVKAQKKFTFLLIDFTRILCRNFYNGIGQKFNSHIHNFSIFLIKNNEELFLELIDEK